MELVGSKPPRRLNIELGRFIFGLLGLTIEFARICKCLLIGGISHYLKEVLIIFDKFMSNSYGVEIDEKVTQSYVLAQDLRGFEHLRIVILDFLDLVSVKNSFIEIIIKLVLFH